MAPVINDSDDDEEQEDLESLEREDATNRNGHENEQATAPGTPHNQQSQSTGSTDRMLKQAHALMMQSITPNHERLHEAAHPSRSPQPSSSNNLKRSRSAAVDSEDGSVGKRQKQGQTRRDDWDVPLTSSPPKSTSSNRARRQQSSGQDPMVIVMDPGSTIMDNTSSDERRERELLGFPDPNDSIVSLEAQDDDGEVRNLHQIGVNTSERPTSPSSSKRDHVAESPGPGRVSKSKSHKENKKSKRPNSDQAQILEEPDELAIGLPEERYNPRPSRSRSYQPSDNSPAERPQASADDSNLRKKRRRTTAPVDDRDTGQLQGLGFSHSQAVRALQETDGNVELAADSLFRENAKSGEENTLRGHRPKTNETIVPTQPSRRSRKNVVFDEEDEEAQLADDGEVKTQEAQDDTSNQAEQSADTERASACKTDKAIANGETNTSRDGRNTKRRRGRPKKSETLEAAGGNASPSRTEDKPEKKAPNATERVDNPQPHRQERENEDAANATSEVASRDAGDCTPDADGPSDSTRKISEPTRTSASPARTSLVKAGSVPLRVGLSRRMKIPSLLQSARRNQCNGL
ncbi:MAG: hypothetical protein Q9159_000746 [Coniocarpon cinnabarinum]